MTCASKRLLGDSGRDAAIGIDAMRAWIGSVAADLLCWGGNFRVHRRKPWSLGERLRNLTPDFMDVRRRNC
ncbi:hypothetical protein, partial [Burkholderia pseudomallei]|uniref:hypothetical protein n=1 Tax=Burkholderia pseudomallei TaxID=28450 RepID=UPI001C82AD39